MELSNFSPKLKRAPELIKENLAQTSTRYSDNPVSLRLNVTKPYEALAAYYLSLYFRFWQTDTLVRSLAHRAYANNYQGKWELVQEVLELELSQPEELEAWFIKVGLANEFFGVILPDAEKIERRVNYRDMSRPSNHYVRRTQRIRGYRDKGSCRLPHEHHGIPPTPEEREDRRPLVHHPLVQQRKVVRSESTRISGDASQHISEKGEN